MPLYTFKNIDNGEIKENWINMNDYDEFVENNPHLQRIYEPIGTVDPVHLGRVKNSREFTNVLQHIKKSNIRSNIRVE